MKLTVTNTSPLPLYRQMYDQLAAQLLRGEIAPGEVLPPIRTVAQERSVSLISGRRAWEELERDGCIHTAVGRGTFAAALGETDKAAMRRAILKEKLTDAAQFCAAVGASGEEAAALLRELRSLLTGTGEYSLDFGDGTTQQGYIVLRPVSMTYRTGTYEQSRAIIDRLSASDNINRISDLSIRRDERSGGQGYQTMLTVTYFEVAP